MARLASRPAPRAAAAAAALLGAAAAWAAPAGGWTSPEAIYSNAAPQVLAVAGDAGGHGFAVYEGGTLDAPLLLSERASSGRATDFTTLTWSAPRPMPGGVRLFTNGAPRLTGAEAGASGDGAGVIALRYDDELLTAIAREPGEEFAGPPATVANGSYGRLGEPAVAISDAGAAIVAVRAVGGRSGNGRVLYSFRPAGAPFQRTVVLSPSDAPKPAVAQAPDGWPVIAWVNGSRAYAARLNDVGQRSSAQRIGAARRRSPITAAVGRGGDGVIAWVDDEGYLRLVRRSAPGTFSWSLPIHRAPGARMTDLGAAVDPLGRAFVSWRETQGSTRRVYVAQAPIGGSFRLTRLATGAELGRPVITARPDGGAAVAWPAPAGWQAKTTTAARWGRTAKVSAVLNGDDREGLHASLIAGPALRVELVWRQLGEAEPMTGPVVYAASDAGLDETATGGS